MGSSKKIEKLASWTVSSVELILLLVQLCCRKIKFMTKTQLNFMTQKIALEATATLQSKKEQLISRKKTST
jgi:hypothetical protein